MTTQINVTVAFGNSSVTDEDKERAEAAALAVLGNVDPAVAFAEFLRQFEELDSWDEMTGYAHLWVQAQEAADRALTEGWHAPGSVHCEISA